MNQKTEKIVKWLAYALLFVILTVLQTNVLPHITLLGAHPNLLPLAAAMVAVLEGGVPGALFGVFAGLCCDALIPPFEFVHMVYFFLSGLIVGRLTTAVLKKTFVTAALCAIVSLTALDVILLVLFYLIPRRAGLDSLMRTTAPEILFSALCTPLVYWPLRAIHQRWATGEEVEEG